MPINRLSASVIQSFARRLVALDAESAAKIQSFDEKVIHLQIIDLSLEYFISVENAELKVSETNEREVSASIKGNLAAFIAAAANEHSADSIFKGELHFSGEISTAKKFQSFIQSLDIDWQEPLAQIFGDPIGHSLAKGMQLFSGWLLQTGDSARQDISEYLQEEIKVTPPYAEQQVFFDQVDQLRSRADRLQAKINHLNSKLGA